MEEWSENINPASVNVICPNNADENEISIDDGDRNKYGIIFLHQSCLSEWVIGDASLSHAHGESCSLAPVSLASASLDLASLASVSLASVSLASVSLASVSFALGNLASASLILVSQWGNIS